MRRLLQRVGFYLLTAWAAFTLNFLIPRMMPGSPVQALLAKFKGRLSPASQHAIAAMFGLGKQDLVSAYFSYWGEIFHGNLGVSFSYFPSSVASVINDSAYWTLGLVGISTIVSFVLGTYLGIVIGWRRASWLDSLLPGTTFFTAVPYFWLGLITLFIFGQALGWFPLSGAYSSDVDAGFNGPFIASVISHGFLPAATLIISSLAGWMLGVRNMMVTTLDEEYVLMAEAKGLSPRRIMLVYAARNAILPSIASFALSLGFIMGGAILTEVVFSYPGLGYVLYQAVTNEDYPLMQGIFLIITLSVLLANLLADVLYVILDPRTRQRGATA
ncbi:ABC transporter permease [Leifsonia sp. L25]|uniref:ABC transporter permease n=1 Tax=Actinomycetes TaxID=1760 RepID=UPI003D697807